MPLVKSTTSPSPAAPEAGAGTDDHDQSAKKIKTNDGEGAPADAGTPSADADTDADDEIRPKDESKTSDVQEEGDLKRKKPSSDDASADDADKKGGTDESSEKKESSQVSSADSIFYKPHPSRTFLCTVSVNKNEAMVRVVHFIALYCAIVPFRFLFDLNFHVLVKPQAFHVRLHVLAILALLFFSDFIKGARNTVSYLQLLSDIHFKVRIV